MKKFYIIFSLLLIICGALGFAYLIHINGAGPKTSWGLGMGPIIIGCFVILKTLILYQRRRK